MFESSKLTLERVLAVSCAVFFPTLNLANVGFAQMTGTFESPPILQARELAAATLLNGSGFHVPATRPARDLRRIAISERTLAASFDDTQS